MVQKVHRCECWLSRAAWQSQSGKDETIPVWGSDAFQSVLFSVCSYRPVECHQSQPKYWSNSKSASSQRQIKYQEVFPLRLFYQANFGTWHLWTQGSCPGMHCTSPTSCNSSNSVPASKLLQCPFKDCHFIKLWCFFPNWEYNHFDFRYMVSLMAALKCSWAFTETWGQLWSQQLDASRWYDRLVVSFFYWVNSVDLVSPITHYINIRQLSFYVPLLVNYNNLFHYFGYNCISQLLLLHVYTVKMTRSSQSIYDLYFVLLHFWCPISTISDISHSETFLTSVLEIQT